MIALSALRGSLAAGQTPKLTPQSPIYSTYSVNSASQLTINYTLGPMGQERCPLTEAAPADKSQIAFDIVGTFPAPLPAKATVRVSLSYGAAKVPFSSSIADVAWDKTKNQYIVTTEQITPFADALAKSASKVKDLDQDHPLPPPGRATFTVTPDGWNDLTADGSLQITFQEVDKIDSTKAQVAALAKKAQAQNLRAQLQNNVAQAQNNKAQQQKTRAATTAANSRDAKVIAEATAQVADAEAQVLLSRQQVAQSQMHVQLSTQHFAATSSATPPTKDQITKIQTEQAAIEVQQNEAEQQFQVIDKLHNATDAAQS